MIQLTKLDDKKIFVNLETIKYMEEVPDTIVFFINGESVLVKESLSDVEKAVEEHHRRINGASST